MIETNNRFSFSNSFSVAGVVWKNWDLNSTAKKNFTFGQFQIKSTFTDPKTQTSKSQRLKVLKPNTQSFHSIQQFKETTATLFQRVWVEVLDSRTRLMIYLCS
jgi:dihydroorotate dehydrogenase